ncbi:hypothetical protein ACEWPM_016830 [Roseovarius sp. S4756]|uniref:hypothetical protein n=1 Tax=Roseovarius maritimus TaxID=3342637 RepID=UPI003B681D84
MRVDPELKKLLDELTGRVAAGNREALKLRVLSEYRALCLSRGMTNFDLKQSMAAAEELIEERLANMRSAPSLTDGDIDAAYTLAVRRSSTETELRFAMRRDLSLQGFSRADVDEADGAIRERIENGNKCAAEIRPKQRDSGDTQQAATNGAKDPPPVGPSREIMPQTAERLDLISGQATGMAPFDIIAGLHRTKGIFEALLALSEAGKCASGCEDEGFGALFAAIQAEIPELGRAIDACSFVLLSERPVPVPNAIMPLVLVGAMEQGTIKAEVDGGRFRLEDMECFNTPEIRRLFNTRADRIYAGLDSEGVRTWMAAAHAAERAAHVAAVRHLVERIVTEEAVTARTGSVTRGQPARRAAKDRPGSSTRVAASRVEPKPERRINKSGLAIMAGIIGTIVVGVGWYDTWRNWIDPWLAPWAERAAAYRKIPFTPTVEMGFTPLADVDSGVAPAPESLQQAAFETWLKDTAQ